MSIEDLSSIKPIENDKVIEMKLSDEDRHQLSDAINNLKRSVNDDNFVKTQKHLDKLNKIFNSITRHNYL